MALDQIRTRSHPLLSLVGGACAAFIVAAAIQWSFGVVPAIPNVPGADPEAIASPTQWAPHPGPPPIGRFFGPDNTPQSLARGDIFGEVWFGARLPGVRIAWLRKAPSAYLLQAIPTSYWPTWTLTSADGQYLYIGGKRRLNGNTVIERLVIGSPEQMIDVSNPDKTILLPAPITEVVTMYDEATEGRDYVSAILEKRAGSDAFLVHFDDSGDVYALQWDEAAMTAKLTLIASLSASGRGVITALGLNRRAPLAWTADHSTLGHVYVFSQGPHSSPHETVVLFDDDRDGDLDGSLTLDTLGWEAHGLHDTENYVTLKK